MSNQIPGKALLLANYGMSANRAAAVLPATGNQTLFTVAGGRILLIGLLGEVTTVASATATNLKLTVVSTAVGGAGTDICANAAITSAPVGTLFAPTAVGAAAQVGSSVTQNNELYVPPGLIRLTSDATNTGAMRWQALWIPVDPGAVLAAA